MTSSGVKLALTLNSTTFQSGLLTIKPFKKVSSDTK